MTQPDTASWWKRLSDLAANGPAPGDNAEVEEFITDVERLTNAARELLRPRAVSPCRARLMRYPVTPKS